MKVDKVVNPTQRPPLPPGNIPAMQDVTNPVSLLSLYCIQDVPFLLDSV